MYYNTERVNITSKRETQRVRDFLTSFDLTYEDIDYTIIIEDNGEIIGTCSKKANIVKCFAIDEKYQGQGISGRLITDITNRFFEEGIYHNFIFTKPSNNFLFQGLGYREIFSTDKVSLLETGSKNIKGYLQNLKEEFHLKEDEEYAAIIMNCNPFTLGHKYIIDIAARESENLLIFVVEEDKSIFPFKDRYELIKAGVKEFKNVTVIPGGEYIISSATFPNYFLRKEDNILKEYTKLDSNIFGKYFCEEFNIKRRYIGTEPYCKVTNTYNETLQEILPEYGVELRVVERKEDGKEAISASKVRSLLKEGKIEATKDLVPITTFEFFGSERGKKILTKLKDWDKVH